MNEQSQITNEQILYALALQIAMVIKGPPKYFLDIDVKSPLDQYKETALAIMHYLGRM
jgi:hypothetical protein